MCEDYVSIVCVGRGTTSGCFTLHQPWPDILGQVPLSIHSYQRGRWTNLFLLAKKIFSLYAKVAFFRSIFPNLTHLNLFKKTLKFKTCNLCFSVSFSEKKIIWFSVLWRRSHTELTAKACYTLNLIKNMNYFDNFHDI